MHVWMHVYICARLFICVCVCICVCLCVCMFTCVCVCMCVRVCEKHAVKQEECRNISFKKRLSWVSNLKGKSSVWRRSYFAEISEPWQFLDALKIYGAEWGFLARMGCNTIQSEGQKAHKSQEASSRRRRSPRKRKAASTARGSAERYSPPAGTGSGYRETYPPQPAAFIDPTPPPPRAPGKCSPVHSESGVALGFGFLPGVVSGAGECGEHGAKGGGGGGGQEGNLWSSGAGQTDGRSGERFGRNQMSKQYAESASTQPCACCYIFLTVRGPPL